MQGIGHQLGELFLGAVPTAVIILIFFLILRSLFFQPLLKVLAEREARTTGARREAEVAQAAAAEKERQYDEALKHALAQVYQEQEAARQKLAEERNAQLKESRAQAAAEVSAAKQRIAAETAAAKRDLEGAASQLAAEIVRKVLQSAPVHKPPLPSAPVSEAR
jgi:F-type H+-transporting ATPase subunit b